ncbi:MAG TPA: hypothetical protein VFC23_02485, partial [Thermoanaerobaculia bacterium]|nr:hypothetical protein [Thermoanaerobaculia bacterium]
WAVRWGAGAGIFAGFANAGNPGVNDLPVYFSPVPLATQLITRTIDVRVYKASWTGGGSDVEKDEARTFSNIDLDLWGRTFLGVYQQVLMPLMATAVATLDGTRYTSLLNQKEKLAGILQDGLANVLVVPGQTVDPAAVQERFRQALLQSLSGNYDLASVVQLPAQVQVAGGDTPPVPPNLYGDVSAPKVDDSHAFALSPAKLAASTGRIQMPYLVSTKDPAAQAFIDLDLSYVLGFVEHDFEPARELYGYIPSSWLGFITPLFAPAGGPPPLVLAMGHNQIPIPLRAYPAVPTLPVQQAEVRENPSTLEESVRWAYNFAVTGSQSAQDRLTLRILFNEQPKSAPSSAAVSLVRFSQTAGDDDPPRQPPQDLYEALARFSFELPQIEPHLAKVPAAAFEGKDVPVARKALERFQGLVDGVVATWQSWQNPAGHELRAQRRSARLNAGDAASLPRKQWTYVVDFQKLPSLLVTRTIEDSVKLPPWPVIAGFQTPPDQGQKQAEYTPLSSPVSGGGGQLQVSVPGLFLMTRQSARTQAQVDRNANLVPSGAPAGTTVNPAFVYTTPVIELQDPVVPLVSALNAIDMPAAPTLTVAIDQVFAPFVSDQDPDLAVQELRFSLDSFYLYRLAGGAQADQTLISSTPNFLLRENTATAGNSSGKPPRKLEEVKKELVKALTQWFKAMQPSTQNASLRFALTVYSTMDSAADAVQLPLARFTAVRVPVPPDNPSWWNG